MTKAYEGVIMNSRLTRRSLFAGAATTTAAVGLTGCLASGDSGDKGGGGAAGGGTDGPVTILGAFGGQEEAGFKESLKAFQEETGIEIQYTPDQDFTTTVRQRISAGDAPDIAMFPQPGGLLEQAEAGTAVPLDDVLDLGKLKETLIPGFLESATAEDGKVYGAPMRMACKSLIWYPKKAYEAGGYSTEPKTMEELAQITQKIKDDLGIAPWSDAWNADQATGWVGTDWLEEVMLRLHGPDVYDQWTKHEIPFNDPQVLEAFAELEKILLADGNVLGGATTIVNTSFSEAPLPLFEDPARAMLVRQGNFVTGFFPEEILSAMDEEVGVFAMPTYEGGFDGQPILGGGDLVALFNKEKEDAKKVLEFLTSPDFGGPWAKAGGWLSPHKTFDESNYADETTRRIAKIAGDAKVFRYDGSDLMPNAVGGGTFWTGMVEWVEGTKTAEQVAQEIEDSWPQ